MGNKCQKRYFSCFLQIMWQNFWIDGGGISQVSSHASGQLNLQREKAGPCFFIKRVKAEVFQALKTVDSNFSFALAHGNGKLFRETFWDSDITKGYKRSKTKIKYSIQFGLAPYFMQSI